jgi:hypothetical protein
MAFCQVNQFLRDRDSENKRKILAGLGFKPSQREMVFSSTHLPKKELNFTLESGKTAKIKDVDHTGF